MAKIQKAGSEKVKNASKKAEQEEPLFVAGGNTKVYSRFARQCGRFSHAFYLKVQQQSSSILIQIHLKFIPTQKSAYQLQSFLHNGSKLESTKMSFKSEWVYIYLLFMAFSRQEYWWFAIPFSSGPHFVRTLTMGSQSWTWLRTGEQQSIRLYTKGVERDGMNWKIGLTNIHIDTMYKIDSYWTWEKAMAPHSSTVARKIPWMEEPGRL